MDSRLIWDAPAPGCWNMAVDEVLLEQAAAGAPPGLRFYRWSEPTLSLGYFQSVRERTAHAESRPVPLVRRSTGGGAILHHFELTYSFSCPAGHPSASSSLAFYRAFHETARDLLLPLGLPAQLASPPDDNPSSGRAAEPFLCFLRRADGDLLVGEHKVLGSAQRRRQGALLQHGSLLFRRSPHAPELIGLEELGAGSVDWRTWTQNWVEGLAARLGLSFADSTLSEQEKYRASQVEAEKFNTDRWNARR
jgi:lipoyl(octanoyl) transferase